MEDHMKKPKTAESDADSTEETVKNEIQKKAFLGKVRVLRFPVAMTHKRNDDILVILLRIMKEFQDDLKKIKKDNREFTE